MISFFIILVSYLNIYLSVKASPFLQKKLSSMLKRKVELGGISCLSPKGIIIKHLVIYNVTNEHPLYYFKALRIRPSIISLIFGKKIKFTCEILPTKKFKAHIYATGKYEVDKDSLFLNFRLKDVPHTRDMGTIYGTLLLFKNPDMKKGEYPRRFLELTFASENILLATTSEIKDKKGGTDIIGKLYSPFIKIDTIQLHNIIADIALVNDKLYVYNFTSRAYKGRLSLDGYIDLNNPVNPTAVSIDIADLDINEFSRNSSLFKKEINGIANAKIKLKGSFGDINSMVGQSWLEIKDANLWESTLFKGVADVLMIPPLKRIIFTEAYGLFYLKNSKISTANFKLISNLLDLSVKGNVGLDDSVDAVIRVKFKKELIDSSAWLVKISSILLESAGQFFGNIKISGTLKEPKYSITAVSMENILEKVKKVIDTVKDILK